MNSIMTTEGQLDIEAILAVLPHRYPFLLVDRVESFTIEKSLTAIKNVTANEPIFTGHFPGNPVFPGVLIIEALAQAAGILSIISHEERGFTEKNMRYLYLFAGIDKARFTRLIRPGDQMILNIEVEKHRKGFGRFKASALVDGEVACTTIITNIRKELGYVEPNS